MLNLISFFKLVCGCGPHQNASVAHRLRNPDVGQYKRFDSAEFQA